MRLLGHRGAPLPDDVLVSVQNVSRWYPEIKRMKLPRYLRWLPTKPVGGGGFDEDDLDDEFLEFIDEGPSFAARGLRELSFDVKAGAGLALLGPDEIARDALIRVLARFAPPTTGRVLIRGRVAPLLTFYLSKFMRSTGQRALFEVALFMGWPISLVRERMPQILTFARLNELAGLTPDVYGAYLTRRLVLSTALHVDATVYLVGHRFSRDDVEFAEHCFELLARRRAEGAAVIYMGDMEEAARVADDGMWFEDGRVVAQGPLHELRQNARGAIELEAALIGADPVGVHHTGGYLELLVDGVVSGADVRFALTLTGRDGQVIQLSQPAPFRADGAGSHRLSIRLPGGLTDERGYEAVLVATVAGAELRSRDLLAFEVVPSSSDGELMADDDGVQVLDPRNGNEPDWRFERVGS